MQQSSRTWTWIAVASTLAIVASVFGAILLRDTGNGASAAETDTSRTVTVSGQGQVSLPPDTAYLTLGVEISDPDLAVAQSTAAEQMDAVLAALKANGVADDDIQTAWYSISVERDYNQPSQPITGYHVSHSVTAKVRQLDATGATLAAAVDAGANSVSGVSFGLEDPGAAVAQARELAVADARAKAEDLARLTESTLGPVISISEGASAPAMPVDLARNADLAADALAPEINPGQSLVTLSVTVTYALN